MKGKSKGKSSPSPKRNAAILLLGPTGSGKTPLGDLIQQRGLWGASCLHFDFGENLRRIVRQDRPEGIIGRADIEFLRSVLESGALLEDEHFPIAQRILRSFLATRGAGPQTVIVLNGLPRHAGQAKAIEPILDVETVIWLECSVETVLQRIATNVGRDRTERVDDDPSAVRSKLTIFHQRTAPLVQHYTQRGARIEALRIAAEMTPEQAWEALSERR